tara:strand:- start:480 stop:698 length:219 start_codon:yes stop_codon:yes gene_type:complete
MTSWRKELKQVGLEAPTQDKQHDSHTSTSGANIKITLTRKSGEVTVRQNIIAATTETSVTPMPSSTAQGSRY